MQVVSVCRFLGVLVVGGADAGPGQDVEAEVAAGFDPVVVLHGQDGADEANHGVAGGEDAPTSVLRRISRLSLSWGLLDQIWRQISLENEVNARTSAR